MKKTLLSLIALLTIGLTTWSQVPNYVPTNGLVGYWPFDGNANDESGNGNNGTVNGATLTTDRFGNPNAVYDFDGMDDFIQVANSPELTPDSNLSINFWVNKSSFQPIIDPDPAGAEALISLWGTNPSSISTDRAYVIYHNYSTSKLKTVIYLSDNSTVSTQFDLAEIELGQWQMITCTYLGNGFLNMYLNGTLISQTIVQSSAMLNQGSYPLSFMLEPTEFGDDFNDGKLDDIGIWNRVLAPCEIQQLYTASIDNPTATITPSGSTTFCQGGSVTLTAGTGSSYLWSNGQTTQSITVGQTGNYSVTVTDNNGCQATSVATNVVVNPNPTISVSGNTQINQGQTTTLNANGASNYSWSTGDNTTSISVSPSSTTTYTVVGTGGNGCTSQTTVTVNVAIPCTATIAPTSPVICSGQSVTLTASTTGNLQQPCDGTDLPIGLQNGLVAYHPFCGNANDESGNGNDATVNGATLSIDRFGNSNSAYEFDGTDDWIELFSMNQPTATVCGWFKTEQTVKQRIWDNGGAGSGHKEADIFVENDVLSAKRWTDPLVSTSYDNTEWHFVSAIFTPDSTVMYLDGVRIGVQNAQCSGSLGCSGGSYGSLQQNSCSNQLGRYRCPASGGEQDYFDGKIDDIAIYDRALNATEIQELFSLSTTQYLWNSGSTTETITVSPNQTTTYSVTITENGQTCSAQVTVTVVNPVATITANGSTSFCNGGNVTLTANSGSGYQWSSGQTNQSITVNQSGNYSVIVTDNGCTATSQSVPVTVLSNPVVTLSSFSDICSNSNPLTLTGGNPSGGVYSVNNTQSTALDPSITGTGLQTISYTYADQNNCSGTATGTVNVLASPSVSLSGLNSNYALSDSPSTLTVNPSGGVLSGNGVSNGEFDPSDAGLGTHSVLYMYVDGNGCMGGDALCTTVDVNVGIDGGNQIASGGGVEIYPNPSSGLYSLSFEIEGVITYSVFDSRGREIVNESFVSNGSATKALDLSDYSNGIYVIQVGATDGISSYKLVKE